MSAEKASYVTVNHAFNLFIDEATMIGYLDILNLFKQDCLSVTICGDKM